MSPKLACYIIIANNNKNSKKINGDRTGQDGFAPGLPFHVRLRPIARRRAQGVVFSCAHAAKAGKGKPKEPVSYTRAGRRPAETEQRPEEVLRQKERLMESERKRAGQAGEWVFLCPSRRRRVRFPARIVARVVSSLLSHALMSGTSSWHIICG